MLKVEEHRIGRENKWYELIDSMSFIAKNLRNSALYLQRQYYLWCVKQEKGEDVNNLRVPHEVIEITMGKKYLNYYMLDKLAKLLGDDGLSENYKLLNSVVGQQVLRQLDKDWSNYFRSLSDYKINKSKYKGVPRIPKYMSKDGRCSFVLTNPSCKIKDGYIKFPKRFQGFRLKTKLTSLKQVKIVPKKVIMLYL